MNQYDSYKHLLGRQYVSGKHDCYGLARDYYHDVFGVQLANFARPERFWEDPELDLIGEMIGVDGWEIRGINIRHLQIGDGLVFAVVGSRANHVGVYVGNGLFIHHFYKHISREEALTPSWTSRLLMTTRHEAVSSLGAGMRPKTDILSLATPYVRSRLISDNESR